MFHKINLGSSLIAVGLFFLPWVELQCSNKALLKQTGVQTIYGGMSVTEEMKQMKEEESVGSMSEPEGKAGNAILVACALGAIVVALLISLVGLFSNENVSPMVPGAMCALALILLAAQVALDFPIKQELDRELLGQLEKSGGTPESKELAQIMISQFQIRYQPALYGTLAILCVPTLLLANSFLDKARKSGTSTLG